MLGMSRLRSQTWRVCQFRHTRVWNDSRTQGAETPKPPTNGGLWWVAWDLNPEPTD